jgi:hypothetical protein
VLSIADCSLVRPFSGISESGSFVWEAPSTCRVNDTWFSQIQRLPGLNKSSDADIEARVAIN